MSVPQLSISSLRRNFLLLLLLVISLCSHAQAPSISSVAPLIAKVGDTITISGSNFDPLPLNNVVYFGATRGEVITASANMMKVVVDTGASYAPISVINLSTGLSCTQTNTRFLPTFRSDYFIQDTINIRTNTFVTIEFVGDPSSLLPYIPVAGDLDGDGKADVIVNG